VEIVLISIFIIIAGLVPSRLIPPPVSFEEVPKIDLGLRQIVVGETFDVVLKFTPSTAYSWKVASISPGLVQVGEVKYKQDPDNFPGQMIGGTALCVFTFRAKSASQGAVTFFYSQSLEKNSPPARRAEVLFVALGK